MTSADPCTHLWDIEAANGPTSLGRCVHCGTEKHFRNHIEIGQKLFALSAGNVRDVDGYFRDVVRERQARTRRGG